MDISVPPLGPGQSQPEKSKAWEAWGCGKYGGSEAREGPETGVKGLLAMLNSLSFTLKSFENY